MWGLGFKVSGERGNRLDRVYGLGLVGNKELEFIGLM